MSTETPNTPVAATPPTPENVADMLTSGDNDYHDGNQWKPSLYADGNVLHIGIIPYSEPDEDDLDDEPVKLPEVHFRAVVVEGETAPIVFDRATFERRINERFNNAINKLAFGAPEVWPAHIAALREQILNLDFDLEAVQGQQDGGQADV